MSEQSDNNQEQQTPREGGWHDPITPSLWKPKTEEETRGGWVEPIKMPAFPTDMSEEPEQQGGWHRPRPEDTSLTEEDELEVTDQSAPIVGYEETPRSEALRPEDLIYEILNQKPSVSAPRPEDFEFPVAGRDDDDEEDIHIGALMISDDVSSEYEALSRMATDDSITTPLEDADATQLLDMTGEAPAQDEAPADPNDPAEYARRQLQAMQGGASLEQAPAQPQLTPEQAELARKFRDTQQQVQVLRSMYNQGQLSYDDLQNQLRALTVLDDDQQWWMLGIESDAWYRFDNMSQQWVEDSLPVPLDVSSPLTETGQLNPDDVLAGSLPYLPQDTGGEFSSTQDPYATLGIDDSQPGTPVPRPNQPHYDPNLTQVGSAWDAEYLQGSEPTLANMGAVDGSTMPSMNTVPSMGSIDDDADVIPDYRFDSDSDLYGEYREQERRSFARIALVGVLVLFACTLVTGIATIGGVVLWYNQQVAPYTDDILALANYEPDFKTARILDANGELIVELTSPDGGARDEIPLDQMSPYLVHAVLSTENRTFYSDPGFAIDRVIGAFFQNISAGQVVSGASTITQQVARNLILQDQEVTADRKIREILIAMEIARTYDKNFILQLYLNEVFFGNQSYGVEAASRFYFNKSARDLNMAEAALLAGLIQAPAANDPVVNREQSKVSMRNSIRLMLEAGCIRFQFGQWAQTGEPFCITTDTLVDFEGTQARLVTVNDDGTYGGLLAVQLAQVETRPFRPREFDFRYPHFVNYVLAQVESEFGTGTIFQRGFTIHTSLIPRIQNEAEEALRTQVDALVNNGVNTGAVMVTDPTTGAIRAMVGSPDFTNEDIDGQVDNTRTWQQPGSALKPVLYLAALEGGPNGYLTPASILWDVPSQYGNYVPRNFRQGVFYGPVSVRQALQNSYNISAIKALQFVGMDKYIEMAGRMQINFPEGSEFGLPSAVGANEIRLIDMMKAYGIIANGGVYAPLYTIERITEEVDGRTLEVPLAPHPEPTRAISPQLAYVMQNILSDDPSRAGEFGLNSNMTLANAGVPTQGYVGAKTGTSSGARDMSGNPADLWTMGFTHNNVVGVWMGTWDNAPIVGATGFTAAAPVWNRVMRVAIVNRAPAPFRNPGGVVQNTVCRETGTLAGDDCPTRVTEIYIQQQPPPPASQGFVRTVNIDSWTGLAANEWCPENVVSRTVAAIDDEFAVNWLNATSQGRQYAQRIGLPLPLPAAPTQSCQQGQQLPSVRLINPTDGATLSEEAILTGQISAPDLNRYELEYASVSSPDSFRTITTSTQQVPNAGSEIGRWDTRGVPNGEYIVRLAAYSNNGGNIIRTARVRVENILPTPTPEPVIPTQIPIVPPEPTPFGGTDGESAPPPLPFDDPTPTATLAF